MSIVFPVARAQTDAAATDAAQAAPAAVAAEQAEDIEEIVVFSAKRAGVSVDRYAAAITALNSEKLEQMGITNTQDLQGRIPGLVANYGVGIPQVFIRGIGQPSTTLGQDPGVAQFIDGVYVSDSLATYSPQLDIGRIEVLRGPQGTLFGKNATGGTISYYSQRPTFSPSLEMKALAGNLDRWRVQTIANGPLGENVAGRVAVSNDRRDGYTTDLAGGPKLDDQDASAGRASLLYDGKAGFSALLSLDASKERSNGPSFLLLDDPLLIQALGGVPCVGGARPPACQYVIADEERQTVKSPQAIQPTYTRRDVFGSSLTVDYDLPRDFHLKAITGYRSLDWKQAQDADSSSIDFTGANPVDQASHQLSEELDFSGSIGPIDGVAGLYFSNSRADQTNRVPFNQGFPGAPFPQNEPFQLLYNTNLESTSTAAFVDTTYPLTQRLRLDVGLRYTIDKKTDIQQTYYQFSGLAALYPDNYPYAEGTVDACGGQQQNSDGTTTGRTSKDWNALTGKGGLEFDTSDSSMIYAVVSRGYKAGGFSDFTTCGLAFDPEFVTNYELGVKGRFFDKRLSVRLDAYRMDYTDMQLQIVTPAGTTTKNAGKSTIPGAEIELGFEATEQLSLDGALNYMDGHFDEYSNTYPLGTGQVEKFDGTRLPNNPRWSGGIGINYVLQLAGGSLTTRADGTFTSSYRFNPYTQNDVDQFRAKYDEQSGYGIGNLTLTYEPDDERWKIQAFVKNVTDQYYLTSVLDLPTTYAHAGFANLPRTFGIEISTTLR